MGADVVGVAEGKEVVGDADGKDVVGDAVGDSDIVGLAVGSKVVRSRPSFANKAPSAAPMTINAKNRQKQRFFRSRLISFR